MRGCLGWILAVAMAACGEEYWPSVFRMAPVPTGKDSAASTVSTRHRRDEGEYRQQTRLEYTANSPDRFLAQGLTYHLDFDPARQLWEHFAAASGTVVSKRGALGSDYLGFEWNPGAFLDWGNDHELLEGRLSAGPVAYFAPGGVPVKISAGGAGVVWSPRLRDGVLPGLRDSSRTSLGGYGGLSLPGFTRSLPQSLLYFDADLFAQTLGSSKLLLGTSHLLLRRGFPSRDTVFAWVADTLSLGNESFFGPAGGEQRYISRPNQQRNNLGTGFGVRGASRLMLIPSLAYLYSHRTVTGSIGPADPRNERGTGSVVAASVASDSALPFKYRGGIRFDRSVRDRLPGLRFTSLLPDDSLRTLYTLNLSDVERFGARMLHQAGYTFPNAVGVLYRFSVSRDSRTYPFVFHDQSRRVHENDEGNDIVTRRHFWEVTAVDKERVGVKMIVEYRKTLINFIHARRSAVNTTDSTFMLGLITRFRPLHNLIIYDTLRAGADVTRYHFPAERLPNEGSPYSRSFFSRLRLEYRPTPAWGTVIDWMERYEDMGRWYATEGIDTMLLDDDQRFGDGYDYYGRENRVRERAVSLALSYGTPAGMQLEGGVKFDIISHFFWDSDPSVRDFVLDASDRGGALRPFLDLRVPLPAGRSLHAGVMPVVYLKRVQQEGGGHSLAVSESYFDMDIRVTLRF